MMNDEGRKSPRGKRLGGRQERGEAPKSKTMTDFPSLSDGEYPEFKPNRGSDLRSRWFFDIYIQSKLENNNFEELSLKREFQLSYFPRDRKRS